MSYIPISETNVTLTTTNVATRGFGTILCIDSHNQFLERFREYSSAEEAAVDLPTTSKAYAAVTAAFSVDPKPKAIKIGRRLCNAVLTPTTTVASTTFTVRIRTSSSVTTTITVTSDSTPTLAEISAALTSAINANGTLSAVLFATDNTGSVTITRDGGNFAIELVENLTIGSEASSESPADVLAAIQAETTDFYCIASTDRGESFVYDMAVAVAATKNVYTYATYDSDAYGTYSASSTDLTAVIKLGGNKRVIHPVYVQESQMELYPEIRIFASKAGYQPGDVIYSNIVNLGILPSKTSDGLLLSNTQKANLAARGLSYFENQNGVTVLRRGAAQGAGTTSWADETIGADYIEARVNEQVQSFFMNQYSEKVGGSSSGYARIESVIRTVLDSMLTNKTTARLLRKYDVTIPTDADITAAIRAGRVATISIAAYLEGALDSAVINVTLTY